MDANDATTWVEQRSNECHDRHRHRPRSSVGQLRYKLPSRRVATHPDEAACPVLPCVPADSVSNCYIQTAAVQSSEGAKKPHVLISITSAPTPPKAAVPTPSRTCRLSRQDKTRPGAPISASCALSILPTSCPPPRQQLALCCCCSLPKAPGPAPPRQLLHHITHSSLILLNTPSLNNNGECVRTPSLFTNRPPVQLLCRAVSLLAAVRYSV